MRTYENPRYKTIKLKSIQNKQTKNTNISLIATSGGLNP